MNFKWIEFLIKLILNWLNQSKRGLNQENWIFFPLLKEKNLN